MMQGHTNSGSDASSKVFSLTDAARFTCLSRVTIRRYLDAGKFPMAYRDMESGQTPAPWRVPATDLLALGLRITEPPIQPQRSVNAERPCAEQLAALQVRAAVDRAVAEERRFTIDLLSKSNSELLSAMAELRRLR